VRAVIQRVERAEVRVHGTDGTIRLAGSTGRGLLVLLGVEVRDTPADAAWMAAKIAGLRVFEDADGKMNLGLSEVGGAVLLVPNFTVAGSAAKGRTARLHERDAAAGGGGDVRAGAGPAAGRGCDGPRPGSSGRTCGWSW
jgi:D-tyrosyl-tRNA(Tyr) deacylase